ncbi:hypothetical protein OESDEN_14304, partial [Oesophagostomum dentatum]
MIVRGYIQHAITKELEPVFMLLDSGAQMSFITDKTAERLCLNVINRRPLTLVGFGGHRSTQESGYIDVELFNKFGHPVRVRLYTRDRAAARRSVRHLYPEDRIALQSANIDPDTLCINQDVDPEILLGIDYFWNVVDSKPMTVLPSGLILSNTHFGHASSAFHPAACEHPKFISAEEITAAEYLLIKEHYREGELELKSLDLDAINAHRTAEGLIRCPNRLNNTDSPSLSAAPILLLAHHPLTAMIVMHHHVVNIHCGVHATIAQLRRTFYIPSIRRTVAQILKSCIACKRDNATTFCSARDTLENVIYAPSSVEQLFNFCANRRIAWKFITPLSPWKGGFYERMVGLFKSAYRKAVRRDLLPLQQIQTLVTEIEAVLNSRPITSYRDVNNAPYILKPIDFISPEVQLQLPPLDYSAPNVSNHRLGDWYRETIK